MSEQSGKDKRAVSEDRAIGALIGLASGDAVGTTLEFKIPGSFIPITDMVGGGPSNGSLSAVSSSNWSPDFE